MADRLLLAVAGVAIFIIVAVYVTAPEIHAIQCDGNVPRWMIDAQNPPYDGGGCAQVLPTHEAPPGADWSPYCLGLCIPEQ